MQHRSGGWQRYHSELAAGAGLLIAGAFGIQMNGGLATAQWPASADEFNDHVAEHLDDVLTANLADAVLFVPGYVLLAHGAASWVRRRSGGDRRIGAATHVGFGLVVVAAVTDTVENVLLRIGANDLPASSELVSMMKAFGVVKYVTVGVGSAVIIGAGLSRRWRGPHRRSRTPTPAANAVDTP